MNPVLQVERLWDAYAYARSGRAPWTIFAFPPSLADERGLPSDEESVRYLALLQSNGVSVGLWAHPEITQQMFFACPYEERELVERVVGELEAHGTLSRNFAGSHCELLFAREGRRT